MNKDVLSSNKSSYIRDHLANERTFLAWIRTSLGIMAFGFVVEKFALFIKQISFLLRQPHLQNPSSTHSLQGYSSIFGVLLVAFGTLIGIFAYMKYRTIERQINENNYNPSGVLNILLTLSVVMIGVFLVIYLSLSI